MSKSSKGNTPSSPPPDPREVAVPKCLSIAERGIKDSSDFTNFFSALMTDLAQKTVVANVANAMCNAGGKLLKMVELEIRYGQQVPGKGRKRLVVAIGAEEIPEVVARRVVEAGAIAGSR